MVVHLQKRCVVIFMRVSRQDEHLYSLVSDASSLSMCHNNTSILKISIKISKDLGMSKKAFKQVVTSQ